MGSLMSFSSNFMVSTMRINYKTPRLRFPDFNEPFKKYRLGEISSMFSGATPLTHNKSYYDGDIPFIKSGEISSNITMQFLSQEGLNNSSAKQVIKGDLLYALYGATSGEVAISKINGAINQAVLCIRSSEFLNMYMVELLKLKKKDIVKKYLQGGQGNLSAEIIKSFEVYIPSLDEQITIASFFELINSKIETQEQIIENLEQLKKGYMQKIFSQQLRFKDENGEDFPEWEEVNLSKITEIKTGSNDVQDAVINGKYPFFDRGATIKYLDSFNYDHEAIIYAGEGSEFIPRYFNGKYALHQRCYTIHNLNIEGYLKYIHHYLTTKNNHFLSTSVGTTVKSLRMQCFDSCIIQLPSKIEQLKILTLLDRKSTRLNSSHH